MKLLVTAGLALALAAPALQAQDTTRVDGVRSSDIARMHLPPDVAEQVVEYFNDPQTLRLRGPTHVSAGQAVIGDVGVLGGSITIAGRIEGRLAVLNGDVELLPGAVVSGGVLVVGGEIHGLEDARVGGEVVTYSEPMRYRSREGRIVRLDGRRQGRGEERSRGWIESDFTITTGKSYNRVEGLPITFGPDIETAGANPLRIQALGIYRSESGLTLNPDRLGYYLRAEQFLGGHRAARVGVTAHSLVDPIEDWHLTDLENSLATFFLHEDYRDHYERKGVSAFAALDPEYSPYALRVEVRWEDHRTLAVGSPWTLFDNADPWRPQPLVGEGNVATVTVRGAYDTRSQAADPATGWHLEGEVERSIYSDLVRPAAYLGGPEFVVSPEQPYDGFTTGTVDLRRYNRLDPTTRLNFRLVAGGSLDGSTLPPQYQHALGGAGSLPGYDLFSRDCGARSELVYRPALLPSGELTADPAAEAYFPRYGCDAFALLQAEFRSDLSLRFRWDADPWRDEDDDDGGDWEPGWELAPDWAVFVDAGRGWALDGGPDTELAVDVGVGLLLDQLGIYLAAPLTGSGGVNFFVRLGPRF